MAQTIAEKILSAHSGRQVRAGEICVAEVDFAFAQDGTAPLAIESFRKLGGERLARPQNNAFFIDHNAPSPSFSVSRLHRMMEEFGAEQGLKVFGPGSGVCHVLMAEQGLVKPGALIVGADSHTLTAGALNALATGVGSTDLAAALISGKLWFKVPETIRFKLTGKLPPEVYAKDVALFLVKELTADGATYRSLEPVGPVVGDLSVEGRFTVANMAMEAGAKTCLFELDEEAFIWLEKHGVARDAGNPTVSDPDAEVVEYERDLSELTPLLAEPHQVDKVCPVSARAGLKVNLAFLGTCTNGRLEDLLVADRVIGDRRIHPACKFIVAPGSRDIFLEAMKEGIIQRLVAAGAILVTPGCGPCVGTHEGVPADGEIAISTANRNFRGRMGNPEAEIYLASPATVAASAVAGEISDPREG